MRIRDREDIVDVLAQCEAHWLVNRIPEARVDEMRDELHQHLREATRDGKTVESVVGDDVLMFAESWVQESRPAWPMYRRVAWFGDLFATMVAVFAVLMHLLWWDLAVPVRWSEAALLLVTGGICGVSAARVRGLGSAWQASWPVVIAASLLIAGAAWGLSELTTGQRNGVVLVWPWYWTAAAAALAVALGRIGDPVQEGSA